MFFVSIILLFHAKLTSFSLSTVGFSVSLVAENEFHGVGFFSVDMPVSEVLSLFL